MTSRAIINDVDDLPLDVVKRYAQHFISAFRAPFGIQSIQGYEKGKWTWYRDGYLTDGSILSHLLGKYWIGTTGKKQTRTFTFDLDNHHEDQDAYALVHRICAAFPEATPLAFSSPGLGVHLQYLTDDWIWMDRMQAFIQQRLAKLKLGLIPGQIELFPSTRLFRAPLGNRSLLLDLEELVPISYSRKTCILATDALIQQDKIERMSAKRINQSGRSRNLSATGHTGQNAGIMTEVNDLIYNGLTRSNQRMEALLKLNYYFATVMGMEAEDREQVLCNWIDRHHNNYSKDYTRNPKTVYQHINRIVKGTPTDLHSCTPGVILEPRPDLDPIEYDLWKKIYTYAYHRQIDLKDGWMEVEIPSRTLKNFHRNYGPILRSLMDKNYLHKFRNYSTESHRCNGYRVRAFHI